MADWLTNWWSGLQQEWWQQLTSFEQVFWYIAIPFTVVFAIQLLSTILGFSDSDPDSLDEGFSDAMGFRLLTIRNLVIFFMVFGWAGIAVTNAGGSEAVTLGMAVATGLVIMLAVSAMFYFVTRLAVSGTMNMRHAEGRIGEVYLPIPGAGAGSGKIQVRFQGSLREVEAMTEGPALARGELVQVERIISGNKVLVKKHVEEENECTLSR